LNGQVYFWDIRPSGGNINGPKDGSAVCTDSCDNAIIAHNFFGNVRSVAVSANNIQKDRVVDGRKGECRNNVLLNNVFAGCPRRIYLGRGDANVCDGNLYDAGNKVGLFDIQDPSPTPKPQLDAWQKTFGQDKRSLEVAMEAAFDATEGQFRFSCGKVPDICVPVPQLGQPAPATGPGPFGAEAWKTLRDGKQIVVPLPAR
jgi:hypothetical protein